MTNIELFRNNLEHFLTEEFHESEFIMLHVGIKSIAENLSTSPVDAAESILRVAKNCCDSAVFIPAFNYKFTETRYFSVNDTAPTVGGMSSIIFDARKLDRTRDPMFGVFTTERKYADLGYFNVSSAFVGDTVWDLLSCKRATHLSIGLSTPVYTQVHWVEQKFNVPYRKNFSISGVVDSGVGEQSVTYDFFGRMRDCELALDWRRIHEIMNREAVLMERVIFPGVSAFGVTGEGMRDSLGCHLIQNKYCLVRTKPEASSKFSM